MAVHLRVYPPPPGSSASPPAPSVHVRLGDLLPLITLAKRQNYLWLQDFLDDEVAITEDLYEVLRTFCSYHRPSA